MEIVYQSFDPSVNPGLFPSATVKELKTVGDDIALRLCGVIDFEAFRPNVPRRQKSTGVSSSLQILDLPGMMLSRSWISSLTKQRAPSRRLCPPAGAGAAAPRSTSF
ncbi:MAG: hypothetical protein V8T46_11285 [Sutterella seckii]